MRTRLLILSAALAAACSAAAAPDAANPAAAPAASAAETAKSPSEAALREVTIPAGTVLAVELQSAVASDTSSVEDPVRARLRKPIMIDGVEALPAGSSLRGFVTEATRSARVKGRARVGFRFNSIEPAGRDGRLDIRTNVISREAPGTKKQDAAKIGIPAAGGAVIGGIVGGGDGAAKGAVIGGAAGTGVVLSTRGKEVRFGPGADFSVKLAAPLTVRVPVK
ncbi:MAG TPA: hypothetical protein VHI98_25810 [Vicinamibacterales bacterium]|jgi:hypothetical protein|nr:hypothetical protein [Vicinamibacterales bacterium]